MLVDRVRLVYLYELLLDDRDLDRYWSLYFNWDVDRVRSID